MRFLHIFTFLISFCPFILSAQICGFTHVKNDAIERYTEGYVQQFLQSQIQPRAIARIPVVVHVVWKNEFENISDAQIQSQIDALNRDFRKRNTVNPVFLRFAVDCEIEFCLAKRDTNGNATTGIDRKQSSFANFDIGSSYFDSVSRRVFYTTKGGADAWNPQKYLNIWVCAFSNGFLGVASSPAKALIQPKEDGIVVDYRAFGTIGTLQDGRQNGRIAVHEAGHYFDLLHIWGSDTTCIDDDLVDDTPRQAGPHEGCPVDLLKSCNNSLDYFRNYMDYTNDDCISFFTAGQKARMWAAINGYRASLLTSNSCEPVAVTTINSPIFETYPNPAHSFLTLSFKNVQNTNPQLLQIRDCFGRIVLEKRIYTERVVDVPLVGFGNGVYFLSLDIDNQLFVKKIIVQN